VTEITVQILTASVAGAVFRIIRMGGREWGIAIALDFASLPFSALIRLSPYGSCELFFKTLGFLGHCKDLLPTSNPEAKG
jgi:P-type Ca2+ transporter type 2C